MKTSEEENFKLQILNHKQDPVRVYIFLSLLILIILIFSVDADTQKVYTRQVATNNNPGRAL